MIALTAAMAAFAAPLAAPADPALESARVLVQRLRASGRAEASVELTRLGLGGDRLTTRGRLVLEPPDRARLDFSGTGERITLRADGGEWLEPQQRQMLRLGRAQAAAAMAWWGIFLDSRGHHFREQSQGGRRFVVRRSEDADSLSAESAIVLLGEDGLPARVEPRGGLDDGGPVYTLHSWRFSHARGRAAFVLDAPPGYTVVDLP